jgi:hypothetical protein
MRLCNNVWSILVTDSDEDDVCLFFMVLYIEINI